MNYKAFDVFSGCGGLSQGLHDAGFKVLGGVEILPHARETYLLNHPNTILFTDVRNIQAEDLFNKLQIERGELDLLAGCPPCQGFSTMRTKNRSEPAEDERNELIFNFINLAEILYPKTIMVENVPGLLKDWRLAKAKNKLQALGYDCKAGVLDAQKFGVPQRRKRMILMASRIGKIELPVPDNEKTTVRDIIGSLPSLDLSENPLHQYRKKHNAEVMARIKKIPKNGGSRCDLDEKDQLPCHMRMSNHGFKDVYGRLAWDKVAPTITKFSNNPSKGRFLHPEENRALTLYEAALLQSFPASFIFPKTLTDSQIAGMIGEALPPLFAKKQALHIKKHLHENIKIFIKIKVG